MLWINHVFIYNIMKQFYRFCALAWKRKLESISLVHEFQITFRFETYTNPTGKKFMEYNGSYLICHIM